MVQWKSAEKIRTENGPANDERWILSPIEGNNKYYIQSAFVLPDEGKKKQEERLVIN